jgi:hypothetical protein
MSVETHLKELLYKHSRVVLADFGTLMAHNCAAQQNALKNTMTPPRKKVTFRPSDEADDGLLMRRVQAHHTEPEQAGEELKEIISGWKNALQNENSVQIEGVGTIFQSRDGNFQFASERSNNFLPSSFGLPEIELRPIQREEDARSIDGSTAYAGERRLSLKTAEELEEETSPLLPWLKYASMILLLISVSMTAYYFYQQEERKKERVETLANTELSGYIEGAIFYQESPLQLPPVEIEVTNKFHVVAGAYRLRENAERRIKDLRYLGFEARYVGKNDYELHQVAYGSFPTRREARKLLDEVRAETGEKDAWILEWVQP